MRYRVIMNKTDFQYYTDAMFSFQLIVVIIISCTIIIVVTARKITFFYNSNKEFHEYTEIET